MLRKLLLYALYICIRLVDFVHSNNNFNPGCLCMVNCFYGLRHDTVICGNDQNRDIGRLRAAHTHGGKCFVARRI